MVPGESDGGGQGSEAAMLWKQLDWNPEWPLFVSVVVHRGSCREVGRCSLPHEQRVVANGMSQCFTVWGWGQREMGAVPSGEMFIPCD